MNNLRNGNFGGRAYRSSYGIPFSMPVRLDRFWLMICVINRWERFGLSLVNWTRFCPGHRISVFPRWGIWALQSAFQLSSLISSCIIAPCTQCVLLSAC